MKSGFPAQNPIRSAARLSGLLAAISLFAVGVARADLVFDNITPNDSAGNFTATGSTPNTYMGSAFTLAAGTTAITGFDLYPVNLTANNYTGLKINIYVWGTVNMGTVSASTPAFGNLLGSYSLTTSGNFASGFYFPFEGNTPGVDPGVTLGAPLAISSQTIGITLDYQGTTDGVTYSAVNNLTSLLAYGNAASVGSEVFSGYYRNANGEVNGNFTSGLRVLTGLDNQSLALRIYGTVVPEPATYAIAGMGAMSLLLFRRRQ